MKTDRANLMTSAAHHVATFAMGEADVESGRTGYAQKQTLRAGCPYSSPRL